MVVDPITAMVLIETGAIGVLGIGSAVASKIREKRLKAKLKHTRGRRKKKHRKPMMIGQPKDAVFLADALIHKGDDAMNSLYGTIKHKLHNKKLKKMLMKGYQKDRFEKSFDSMEKYVEKHAGIHVPHQSAMRKIIRFEKQAGRKRALLDRSLHDMKWIMK